VLLPDGTEDHWSEEYRDLIERPDRSDGGSCWCRRGFRQIGPPTTTASYSVAWGPVQAGQGPMRQVEKKRVRAMLLLELRNTLTRAGGSQYSYSVRPRRSYGSIHRCARIMEPRCAAAGGPNHRTRSGKLVAARVTPLREAPSGLGRAKYDIWGLGDARLGEEGRARDLADVCIRRFSGEGTDPPIGAADWNGNAPGRRPSRNSRSWTSSTRATSPRPRSQLVRRSGNLRDEMRD